MTEYVASDPDVGVIVANPQADGSVIRSVFESGIQAAIDKAVAGLPEDKHGAVVAHADLRGNLTLSVVGRIGDRWTYVGAVRREGGKFTGEAAVRYSWP